MKKNILTLGFLIAISAMGFAQTDAARPNANTPPGSGQLEVAPANGANADQKQREDIQKAGEPGNPNSGVRISTPDPRVESPSSPTVSLDQPAATPAARPQNESRPVPEPNQVKPAKQPAAETKPTPASEPRSATPQPATQPKKQTPAKPQKTQAPR